MLCLSELSGVVVPSGQFLSPEPWLGWLLSPCRYDRAKYAFSIPKLIRSNGQAITFIQTSLIGVRNSSGGLYELNSSRYIIQNEPL